MKPINFICAGLTCLGLLGCVAPQEFAALENRVAAIEMENNRNLSRQQEILQIEKARMAKLDEAVLSIKKRMDETPDITRESYAEMKYDIQAAKEGLQKLEGLLEEIKYGISQATQKGRDSIETRMDRLDQAISRNYEKILELEKYMGFEPSVAGETSGSEAFPVNREAGKTEEQIAYDLAKKTFDEGDKNNARILFENFINKYPDSENSDNARFWIADSYYAEKWYEKAILEYQKVLETYPGSNKLAAARLKQGYAFAELGEKANARLILKELIKKHPNANEAKYAREKLKHLK